MLCARSLADDGGAIYTQGGCFASVNQTQFLDNGGGSVLKQVCY